MNNVPPLLGKRILFIGIGFYDYDQAIVSKLKELGAETSYICSTCNAPLYRIFNSLGFHKAAKKYAAYYRAENIRNSTLNNDYIFIIKGECLTQNDINCIKEQNPDAHCILYFWDDLKRIDNRVVLLKNFHNIWSFDPEDCRKYGFKFRPLFYRDNLTAKSEKKIFLSSIGWYHSNRLEIFRNISCQLKKVNKSFFLKLYLGKKTYFIERFIKRRIARHDSDLVITKPIKFDKVMDIISDSAYVLDIPHPSQKGLSIRTIEALKCGSHVFTTNKNISQYENIPKECYTIFNPLLPLDFFSDKAAVYSSPYLELSFSLEAFLKELMEISK